MVAALVLGVRAGPAGAASGCSETAAEDVAVTQLLPYADGHSDFYAEFGGAERLDYQVGNRICRDLTGDGDREMIVHLQCCTGGSPSPWGIFTLDAAGEWQLAYARAADTVFRIRVRGRRVAAAMPAPYDGACTRYTRDRQVRWTGTRFRSSLSGRHRVKPGCR